MTGWYKWFWRFTPLVVCPAWVYISIRAIETGKGLYFVPTNLIATGIAATFFVMAWKS